MTDNDLPKVNEEYMTVRAAAVAVGLSSSALYKAINKKSLPAVNMAGNVRINGATLWEWFYARRAADFKRKQKPGEKKPGSD